MSDGYRNDNWTTATLAAAVVMTISIAAVFVLWTQDLAKKAATTPTTTVTFDRRGYTVETTNHDQHVVYACMWEWSPTGKWQGAKIALDYTNDQPSWPIRMYLSDNILRAGQVYVVSLHYTGEDGYATTAHFSLRDGRVDRLKTSTRYPPPVMGTAEEELQRQEAPEDAAVRAEIAALYHGS